MGYSLVRLESGRIYSAFRSSSEASIVLLTVTVILTSHPARKHLENGAMLVVSVYVCV